MSRTERESKGGEEGGEQREKERKRGSYHMSQKPVTVRFLPNRYVPEVYPLSSPMDETFCAVMGPVCISVVAGRRERGTEGGRGCEIERESEGERCGELHTCTVEDATNKIQTSDVEGKVVLVYSGVPN